MARWQRRFAYWWCGDSASPWVKLKWWLTLRFIDNPDNPRPEKCWSTAICWALGHDSLEGAMGSSSLHCRECAARDGYCYCGRFACRERLVEIGADPSCVRPIEWVAPEAQAKERET